MNKLLQVIFFIFCAYGLSAQAVLQPENWDFLCKKSMTLGDGVGNDSVKGTGNVLYEVTSELKFFFPDDSGYIQMSETDLFGLGLRGIGAIIPVTDGGSLFNLSKHGLAVGGVGAAMLHFDVDSQAYVTARRFNGSLEASMIVVQDDLVGEMSVRQDRLLMSINNSATGLSQGIDIDISGDHPHTHIILWDEEADSANSTTLHAHEGEVNVDLAHGVIFNMPDTFKVLAGITGTTVLAIFQDSVTFSTTNNAIIFENLSSESQMIIADNGAAGMVNGSGEAMVLFEGSLYWSNKGINTTAGDAAEINAPRGRFRKDTSGETFTLTNDKINANSIIILTAANAAVDASATSWTVSTGSGSAVITFNAAPTANFDMHFFVDN